MSRMSRWLNDGLALRFQSNGSLNHVWTASLIPRNTVRVSWEPLLIAVLTNHGRYKCMVFNDTRIFHLRLLQVNRGLQFAEEG